jgi:hypothetical protein
MFPTGSIRDAVAEFGDDWDAGLDSQPFTGTSLDVGLIWRSNDLPPTPAYRHLWLASQGMSNADYIGFVSDLLDMQEAA